MTQQTYFQLPSNISLPFNSGCSNEWYKQSDQAISHCPTGLFDWLFDENSLTQRLRSTNRSFEVSLISQATAQISPQEQSLFDQHNLIDSREVLLLCDGVPHVYARTLIPKQTLNQANQKLKALGNTSLGDVLFNDPTMQRQVIEATYFNQKSSMVNFANQLGQTSLDNLWGRRSIFTLNQMPLLVSEVFLPQSAAYNMANL